MDIGRILQVLPHRYPFLLIDRIIEVDGDNSGIGIKNVTFNERPGRWRLRLVPPAGRSTSSTC